MTVELKDIGRGAMLAAPSPEDDFSLLLAHAIGSIKDNPAQLRSAVYELARFKLQREALQRYPPMNFIEICRMMQALENAILRVETISAKHDAIKALRSLDRLIESWETGASTVVTAPRAPMLVVDQTVHPTADVEDTGPHGAWPRQPSPAYGSSAHAPRRQASPKRAASTRAPAWQWLGAAQLVRGAAVVAVAALVCVVLDRQFGLFRQQAVPATATVRPAQPSTIANARAPAVPNAPTRAPSTPLPDVYGIYALDNGQLYELEAIPGRVPDPKVFMSTPVKTVSRTVLPDGQVAFIVYRRDIAGNAPDRVMVRVIARVKRAMTFSAAGEASTVGIDDQWTIRGNAYELRVAPVDDHPEMLMIRPDRSDFALPAGRYGLVIKGQAYDFTIAGPITDPAQCLERVEAVNGAFYSECRRP